MAETIRTFSSKVFAAMEVAKEEYAGQEYSLTLQCFFVIISVEKT